MGEIITRRNPMDPTDREVSPHNGPLIDFITEKYPRGFPGPTSVIRNGVKVPVPDLDVLVGPDDEVVILISPQGGIITGASLLTALVATTVGMALNYVVSWLRGAPDTPEAASPQTPSPTYSLSTPTNQVRLGETMPVVYGSVLTVPDIVSQPYTYYEANEQFVSMILGVGRGEHAVNHLLVSDTDTNSLAPGVFGWWDFPPSVHQQTFGMIQAQTGIYEDIDTSAEVSNYQLESTLTAGPFNTNRLGTLTQRLGFDFIFPAGIHAASGDALVSFGVDITMEAWEIDDNDNDTGNYYSDVASFSGASSDPIRETWWLDVPRGRYKAAVHRNIGNTPQVGFESRSVWAGLKAVLLAPVDSTQTIYQLNTNTETDLSQWSTLGVDTWGLVATASCDGSLRPRTTNPTFIASDATTGDTTDKSLYRRLDVSGYDVDIDAGYVRCLAEVWASRQSTTPDVPGLLIQFLDGEGTELEAYSSFGTATCTWGLSTVDVSELVPPLTRSIVLLLDATYGGTGFSNSVYFDDVIVTLSNLNEGQGPPVYEDMHLIAVRMKATHGISSDAARRVAVNVTKLNADSNPTYNPADAMKDIFLNTNYGGARPTRELDTEAVEALRQKLSPTAGFNAVFDSQTTVWIAMQQALRLGDAAPTIYGGKVTVIEDTYKPLAAFAFNQTTIVDGSVTVSRNFDFDESYDSYEVEYLDPSTFLPQYVRYPVAGDFPESVSLFGCTNKELAEHQAEFLWEKRYWRRKVISFQTEAVGNLPLVGDLISVDHPVVSTTAEGTGENYIVGAIRPSGQFSVTVDAVRDADIYSPIPIFSARGT